MPERTATADDVCQGCGGPVQRSTTGRPARYCSHACRQRGYRARGGAPKHRTTTATAPAAPLGPVHVIAAQVAEAARVAADAITGGQDARAALDQARTALTTLADLATPALPARDETFVTKARAGRPAPVASSEKPTPAERAARPDERPVRLTSGEGYRLARRDGRRYLLPPGSDEPIGYLTPYVGSRWQAWTMSGDPVLLDAMDGRSYPRQTEAMDALAAVAARDETVVTKPADPTEAGPVALPGREVDVTARRRWYTDEELDAYELVRVDPDSDTWWVVVAGELAGTIRPRYNARGNRSGWEARHRGNTTAWHLGKGTYPTTRKAAVIDLLADLHHAWTEQRRRPRRR